VSGGSMSVAGAYDKINAHEDLCAERYLNIHGRIDLLFRVISWGGAMAFTVLIGLAAWGLNQVNQSQTEQLRAIQRVAVQVAEQPKSDR
jgi:uncharacterized membrane protein